MLHMCVSVAEKIKKATQTKQRENGKRGKLQKRNRSGLNDKKKKKKRLH